MQKRPALSRRVSATSCLSPKQREGVERTEEGVSGSGEQSNERQKLLLWSSHRKCCIKAACNTQRGKERPQEWWAEIIYLIQVCVSWQRWVSSSQHWSTVPHLPPLPRLPPRLPPQCYGDESFFSSTFSPIPLPQPWNHSRRKTCSLKF